MGCCRPPSTTSIPIPSVTWTTSQILRARSIYAPPCATLSGSVAPMLPCSSDLSPNCRSCSTRSPLFPLLEGAGFSGGAELHGHRLYPCRTAGDCWLGSSGNIVLDCRSTCPAYRWICPETGHICDDELVPYFHPFSTGEGEGEHG